MGRGHQIGWVERLRHHLARPSRILGEVHGAAHEHDRDAVGAELLQEPVRRSRAEVEVEEHECRPFGRDGVAGVLDALRLADAKLSSSRLRRQTSRSDGSSSTTRMETPAGDTGRDGTRSTAR
jgi:hypothetical protein